MSTFVATQSHSPMQTEATVDTFKPSLFLLLAHIPLGILLKQVPAAGYVYSFGVICLGLLWVIQKQMERVAYICAYIVGAEVLWRMTSTLFWELGKYAIILLMGLYILLWARQSVASIPIVVTLLLVPGMMIAVSEMEAEKARQAIAFNCIAYVALVACASFVRGVTITREELKRLFFALVLPAISVASIALYQIVTSEKIRFVNDSNFELSGGYGPNQVSSILGLGTLFALLYFLLEKQNKRLGLLMALVGIWLGFQTMMTFSRGGIYCSGGALLCLAGWLKDKQIRSKILQVGIPFLLFSVFFVFPRLDNFTEGKLSKRYEDTGTTHRSALITEELDLWHDNIIFGVGIGQAQASRAEKGVIASHSEFSRLVAEHGIFGIVVMVMMAISLLANAKQCKGRFERSLILAFGVWAFLFTLTAALRLVAPAFLLGLTFARLDLGQATPDDVI